MSGLDDATAELVAAHVAGSLPSALDALVASHVELSPRAGRFAAHVAALAGAAVASAEPVPLADRDGALARILRLEPVRVAPRAPVDPHLPRPLGRFLGAQSAAARWRRLWFGIEQRDFGVYEGYGCGLMRIAGGWAVPEHGHDGLEATLVLRGGFSDGGASFGPGDLHVCDESLAHAPIADPEGCLCAFVIAGRGVVPTSTAGRLWKRILRL